MDELHPLRSARSYPTLAALLEEQRQMSASTPPTLNHETRIPLPPECHIPLPPSPSISVQDIPTELPEPVAERMSPELPIPLLELLQAIQEDKYETRRLSVLQDEAHGLFHKCGSSDRFLTVQAQLYRRMIDCFQNDNKTAFASTYNKAMNYPDFGQLHISETILEDETHDVPGSSWIDRLSSEPRSALLDFLRRLRSDPVYLADKISRLTSSQLRKLVYPHRLMHPGSVFRGSQSQGRYDGRNQNRNISKHTEPDQSVEDLLSDPLLLLIHGIFDNTSTEQSQRIDIWASVCAKLIEDGKPGADEFCLTVVTLFADPFEWRATSKLELFLAELVANGGSFLEAGGQNVQFMHPPHHPQQQRDNGPSPSTFLDPYIPMLLDLLTAETAPTRALNLIRATLAKIRDPERRITARNFFFLRWYCTLFLTNAIVFPENHGIMMDYYITNSIREKVLRELASRIHRIVSDVLSPWSSNPVSPVLSTAIRHIITTFEVQVTTSSPSKTIDDDRGFLFLRPEDLLTIAKSLVVDSGTDSSASSLFGQSSNSSSMQMYPNQFIPTLADPYTAHGTTGLGVVQSQTWHGGRPLPDSGYNTFDRNMPRPAGVQEIMTDVEKDPSLPFIHELWMLTTNRDFHLGSTTKHEVTMLFISDHGDSLSLAPFVATPRIILEDDLAEQLAYQERRILTAAVNRLAETIDKLRTPIAPHTLTTLGGFIQALVSQAHEAKAQFDFQGEYFWWQCIQILENTDSKLVQAFLTKSLSQRRDRVAGKRLSAKEYDDWLHTLRSRSTAQDHKSQKLSLDSRQLRDKMWFISDVRHSSAYEDATNIIRALRAMVDPLEQRQIGVSGWAKQRFRSSFGQERILSQTLELMTAPKTYGGPKKLSESQIEITTGWLLHENIENFCRGEERLHRFCYEIQKCVKRLAGEAMLDSPVLWSSPLYSTEKSEYGLAGHSNSRHSQDRPTWRTDFSYPQWNMTPPLPGQPSFVSPDIGLSASSPTRATFDPMIGLNPGMTATQAMGMPQMQRNWILPPSPVSPGVVKTLNDTATLRRRSFLQSLRAHLTSLLLSDLGSMLWNYGSETDRWLAGLEHSQRPSTATSRSPPDSTNGSHEEQPTAPKPSTYDTTEACRVLLSRFKLTPNPSTKLQYLYELFMLITRVHSNRKSDTLGSDTKKRTRSQSELALGVGSGLPRTRLTRLQEVAANCADRRQTSIARSKSGGVFNPYARILPTPELDDPDVVTAMQEIFVDPGLRPSAFFRDMQYIAAFTPVSVLDGTPKGTAFWTIGLAVMRIKAEKSRTMTDNAMQILEHHYGNGNKKEPVRQGQASPSNGSTSTRKLSLQDLLGTTLQDAARLLTISALEGDPAAARELALFYLTHPELVSAVHTLPLSRPSDVFRAKHGANSDRGHRNANEETVGLDPVTFAVVFHWMEFAANAGDADAITFFKENKDLAKAL